MLERWEIENYLYDKEVPPKLLPDAQLPFDERAYDDLLRGHRNQNLKMLPVA